MCDINLLLKAGFLQQDKYILLVLTFFFLVEVGVVGQGLFCPEEAVEM